MNNPTNYEINFLILQSQTEKLDSLREKVKKIIEKFGGKITDQLLYQKRKLAYEIKHERYGFYTVYRFDLEEKENIKDLTNALNLEAGVVRFIIVRSDELPALEKKIGEKKESSVAEKNAQSTKSKKDVLNELEKETKKSGVLDKIRNLKEKITGEDKDKTAEKDKETSTHKKEKKEEKKISADKKEKKETSAKEKKEKNKEEEISIEDLDKKLDEILDN